MKYICIDDGAIYELISGKEYQSIDFEEGDHLIGALSGELRFETKLRSIVPIQNEEGVFLTTSGSWKEKKYLVIDCTQSSLFTKLHSGKSLQSFQKLLRFCSKYWTGNVLNNSELRIPGTSKAVVFPLQYSDKPYRITIEREPSKERLQKRDMAGCFMLVYKSGWQGGDSATEKADETNFRKVLKCLPSVYSSAEKINLENKEITSGNQLDSTDLGSRFNNPKSAFMPFKEWMPRLTARQNEFVTSDSDTPHRLQGPAGTGKTISLVLKTVHTLLAATEKNEACHALIVTHSEATKLAIQDMLSVIDPSNFQSTTRNDVVSLSVETLASLCAEVLSQAINESEFIDRDAQDSKLLQQLYIGQAIDTAKKEDLPSVRADLSERFKIAFDSKDVDGLSSLFQHEISVQIKGRAGDSFEIYKNCPPLKYGLPVSNDADRGLAFRVYERYQDQLKSSSQFDTDDVVISAIGQLDTPIWRRRRTREGYDFIAIDETHLFNINELHVFHHFTRNTGALPISFTVDQAQGVGDRGWDDISSFSELFGNEAIKIEDKTVVTAVFRNSPQIREFCQSVLANGAMLFTNFENTLTSSQSVFTAEEERKALSVEYIGEFQNDQTLVEGAFRRAEELLDETKSKRAQVLVTCLCDDVLQDLRRYAKDNNKPVTYLEQRGDFARVKQAEKSGQMVLGHADFVGGLEFNVVVIVGVDKGRVPHEGETSDSNSRSFASYSAHNRLYVASSRARYALSILGVKSRGPSEILQSAHSNSPIDGMPS